MKSHAARTLALVAVCSSCSASTTAVPSRDGGVPAPGLPCKDADADTSLGDDASMTVHATALDAKGNAILGGVFDRQATVGGRTLFSASSRFASTFVVKTDPAGAVLWAKGFSSPTFDVRSYSFAANPNGEIVFAGSANGTVSDGGATPVLEGVLGAFVVKLDAGGRVAWAKSLGKYSVGVVGIDPSGAVWTAGTTRAGQITLDTTPIDVVEGRFVIAKYDAEGKFMTGRVLEGVPALGAGAASSGADASGGFTVAGYIRTPSVDFGGGALAFAGGSTDLFVARFGPTGDHIWSRGVGGTGGDEQPQIAVSPSGDVSMYGYYQGAVDVGGEPIPRNTNNGTRRVLARYDANGAFKWQVVLPEGVATDINGAQRRVALATNAAGHTLFVTSVHQNVDFGGGGLGIANRTSQVVVTYDAAGKHSASTRVCDAKTGLYPGGAAIDPSGKRVLTGARPKDDYADGGGIPTGYAGIYVKRI